MHVEAWKSELYAAFEARNSCRQASELTNLLFEFIDLLSATTSPS